MEIFESKPQGTYSTEVVRDVETLMFSKDKEYLPIVGSFGYRIQKYPGDVDLWEVYSDKKFKKDIYDSFIESLFTVIKQIKSKPLFYFSEFKAGSDSRYDIDIGTLKKGVYRPIKTLLKKSKKLLDAGLFTTSEYDDIKNLIEDKYKPLAKRQLDDAAIYDAISSIFHERRTVRWTLQDVEKRVKVLPGGLELSLEDAVREKGIIKIDVYTFIDNKIIEMSNFLVLAKKNKDGTLTAANLDISLGENKRISIKQVNELTSKLKDDVDKYLYSQFYLSPFKAVKRMFSLSRILYITLDEAKYLNFAKKIAPLLESDLGILNQISSEISYINDLLSKCDSSCPIATLRKCISNFKNRLSVAKVLSKEELLVINKHVDQALKKKKDIDVKHLTMLQELLNIKTNKIAGAYVKQLTLPKFIVPEKREYSVTPKFTK